MNPEDRRRHPRVRLDAPARLKVGERLVDARVRDVELALMRRAHQHGRAVRVARVGVGPRREQRAHAREIAFHGSLDQGIGHGMAPAAAGTSP